MSLPAIHVCPGTLAEGFSSYSPACLRNLFNGKKVSHTLPFASAQTSEESAALFIETRQRISIPGVQEKLSLRLEKNRLRLTKPGEHGLYLLKPIPRDVKHAAQVPANEHLTMQIARQVYRINTAENALIFFADGAPATCPDLLRLLQSRVNRPPKTGYERKSRRHHSCPLRLHPTARQASH
jgi:serine/threonine-protein kinase HipA